MRTQVKYFHTIPFILIRPTIMVKLVLLEQTGINTRAIFFVWKRSYYSTKKTNYHLVYNQLRIIASSIKLPSENWTNKKRAIIYINYNFK